MSHSAKRHQAERTATWATLLLALAGCGDARLGGPGGVDSPSGHSQRAPGATAPTGSGPTNAAGGPATAPGASGQPEIGATRADRDGPANPPGSRLGATGPGTGAGSTGPTETVKPGPGGDPPGPR